MRYLRVWLQLTKNAFSSYTSNRLNSLTFSLGKIIRFAFLWLMIIAVFRHAKGFAGYTEQQALLFFITFNLVDVASQAVFRGVYRFAHDVNRGTFDVILTKPINSLFYIMTRLTDILDILFLVPIAAALIYIILQLPGLTPISLLWYAGFLLLGLCLTTAIHIITAALCLWTTENENIIWFYRQATIVATFPPDILSVGWQIVFTFALPIIIMMAYPARALLGTITNGQILTGILVTAFFFGGSLLVWRVSLRQYSSASS